MENIHEVHIFIYCILYIIYIHNPTLYGVRIKNYKEKISRNTAKKGLSAP